MKVLYLIIILMICACDCNINNEKEMDYYYKIGFMSKFLRGGASTDFWAEFDYSRDFISTLSGIEGHCLGAEPPNYTSEGLWIKDSTDWVNWFELNKSNINVSYYDSLIRSLKKKYSIDN